MLTGGWVLLSVVLRAGLPLQVEEGAGYAVGTGAHG